LGRRKPPGAENMSQGRLVSTGRPFLLVGRSVLAGLRHRAARARCARCNARANVRALRYSCAASSAADGIYLNLEAVIMKLVGVGMILNVLASLGIFSYLLHHVGVQQAAWFFATILVAWAFLIIGFIMQIAGRRKGGAALITLGSLVFIPAGLVAIVGSILVARRGDKLAG
jgi:hypothetical protein